ncbi:hypothetical protein CCH79_00007825 [Gambusia affinis]|uniref:SRCR domain-containing protein n=1 Tax=Gambusia affinis TaxID=33528 RepID=A0A315W0R2_GAMAF|nr:hypothetical protein CCH79_00007825 [Gambusia affinis]
MALATHLWGTGSGPKYSRLYTKTSYNAKTAQEINVVVYDFCSLIGQMKKLPLAIQPLAASSSFFFSSGESCTAGKLTTRVATRSNWWFAALPTGLVRDDGHELERNPELFITYLAEGGSGSAHRAASTPRSTGTAITSFILAPQVEKMEKSRHTRQLATTVPSRASVAPTPSGAPQQLKVRLAGYPRKHNEGRIELFYKGEWGTICDDDFSIANANVLCRQLGFVSATGWTHSAKYGNGQGKIWLDNVLCNGGEKSIELCKSRGWGNSDCTHDEDAGVVCKDERIPGFVDSNIIDAQVDEKKVEEVRLRPVVGTAKRKLPITEGVVEVKHKDGWAQICDVGWTIKNTRVVCGMLGFPHERKVNKNFYKRLKKRAAEKASGPKVNVSAAGRQPSKAKANSMSKQSNRSKRLYLERQKNLYLLRSVACSGSEVHLAACPLEFNKPNATATCAGGMPVVVSCMPGPLFMQNSSLKKKVKVSSTVRLKGGARLGEGRVEVLKDNEWGTVCDDRWSLLSASVVCRELGFGSAKEALTGARMGQGMGPIYMNEVKCVGNEKSIWTCPFKNITAEDCQHMEDAAVRCNIPFLHVSQPVLV